MYTEEYKGITVTCDDYHKVDFKEQPGEIAIMVTPHDIKFTIIDSMEAIK